MQATLRGSWEPSLVTMPLVGAARPPRPTVAVPRGTRRTIWRRRPTRTGMDEPWVSSEAYAPRHHSPALRPKVGGEAVRPGHSALRGEAGKEHVGMRPSRMVEMSWMTRSSLASRPSLAGRHHSSHYAMSSVTCGVGGLRLTSEEVVAEQPCACLSTDGWTGEATCSPLGLVVAPGRH